ncbi:MAG: hypothetical protein APF80_11885 [Alphaproteobacteria bacterium BRH_c36]|nr:MAG: hypothetical protein APF80_11885 [Alphaproteobacteria bacterium BRH_c36]
MTGPRSTYDWHSASPIIRRFLRALLAKASQQATADALTLAAADPCFAPYRQKLATQARRATTCAASTHIKLETPPGEPTRLTISNKRRCRGNVCVGCARQRAAKQAKTAAALLQIVREWEPNVPILMFTATSANRPISELRTMFQDHEAALRRFWRSEKIAESFKGHVTSIETALRGSKENPQAGVHSHSIVAAPDYFKLEAGRYLSQRQLKAIWKASLRVSYDPIVDIRRLRGPGGDTDNLNSGIKEITKYAFAPQKVFEKSPFGIRTDPTVIGHLAITLYKRRTMRFGGLFALAKAELKAREQTGDRDA